MGGGKPTGGEDVDIDCSSDWIDSGLFDSLTLETSSLTAVVSGHRLGETHASMGFG